MTDSDRSPLRVLFIYSFIKDPIVHSIKIFYSISILKHTVVFFYIVLICNGLLTEFYTE